MYTLITSIDMCPHGEPEVNNEGHVIECSGGQTFKRGTCSPGYVCNLYPHNYPSVCCQR